MAREWDAEKVGLVPQDLTADSGDFRGHDDLKLRTRANVSGRC